MGATLTKFFSSKNGDITETDLAILKLKTTLRKLDVESNRLDTLISRHLDIARELVKEDKKARAMLALKQKRMREEQLQNVQGAIITVSGVLNNIEIQQQTAKVFGALKAGNEAMKHMQSQVSLEDVEQLKEETAEAHAIQQQMQEALSQSLTPVENDELLQDLQQLEEELQLELKHSLPVAPAAPQQNETIQQQGKQPLEDAKAKPEAEQQVGVKDESMEEPMAA